MAKNSRGVLLSDILCKQYHKHLRKATDPYYSTYCHETQCGGVRHRGSDFAAHLMRAMIDFAAGQLATLCIFFVDIITAFQAVMKSHAHPHVHDNVEVLFLLHQLGLPPDTFRELLQHLAEPSAFEQAEVPAHLLEQVSEAHRQT